MATPPPSLQVLCLWIHGLYPVILREICFDSFWVVMSAWYVSAVDCVLPSSCYSVHIRIYYLNVLICVCVCVCGWGWGCLLFRLVMLVFLSYILVRIFSGYKSSWMRLFFLWFFLHRFLACFGWVFGWVLWGGGGGGGGGVAPCFLSPVWSCLVSVVISVLVILVGVICSWVSCLLCGRSLVCMFFPVFCCVCIPGALFSLGFGFYGIGGDLLWLGLGFCGGGLCMGLCFCLCVFLMLGSLFCFGFCNGRFVAFLGWFSSGWICNFRKICTFPVCSICNWWGGHSGVAVVSSISPFLCFIGFVFCVVWLIWFFVGFLWWWWWILLSLLGWLSLFWFGVGPLFVSWCVLVFRLCVPLGWLSSWLFLLFLGRFVLVCSVLFGFGFPGMFRLLHVVWLLHVAVFQFNWGGIRHVPLPCCLRWWFLPFPHTWFSFLPLLFSPGCHWVLRCCMLWWRRWLWWGVVGLVECCWLGGFLGLLGCFLQFLGLVCGSVCRLVRSWWLLCLFRWSRPGFLLCFSVLLFCIGVCILFLGIIPGGMVLFYYHWNPWGWLVWCGWFFLVVVVGDFLFSFCFPLLRLSVCGILFLLLLVFFVFLP